MKTKQFLTILSLVAILLTSCVKDEIFKDESIASDVTLVINEVASNNGDPNPDWIEIYNPSDVDVDISGFGVYDKPAALYTFPAGTIVPAKGYFVIVCDVALAGGNPALYGAFGISSGGESVFLVDAAGGIIDEVAVPKMDLGISWARIPDGGLVYSNANPTQGVANSNTNEPPVITATLISGVHDNGYFDYTIIASDAGGIRDVKIYIETGTEVKFVEMAPVGSGAFKYRFPSMDAGIVVKYYVVATDETGKKTYFPSTAPTTNASFTVANGLAQFTNVKLSNRQPNVNVTVSVYDLSGVASVKVFYLINSEVIADKVELALTNGANGWTGIIPATSTADVIRYYISATDNTSLESIYPIANFDIANATTWALVPVASPIVLNEVCGKQSTPDEDWIEIFNSSASEVDITGIKLVKDGGATPIWTAPSGLKIAANSYLVIRKAAAGPAEGVLTAGISNTGLVKLELKNASDVILSSFEKTASFPNVGGHVTDGSYARIPNGYGDWTVVAAFTKGTANL